MDLREQRKAQTEFKIRRRIGSKRGFAIKTQLFDYLYKEGIE